MLRTAKMVKSIKGACVVALVTCVSVFVFGLAAPSLCAAQDLTDILTRTYRTNGTIAAARFELKSVVEGLPIAQSGFLPDLEFKATEGRTRIRQSTKDEFQTNGNTDDLLETTTDRNIELDFTLNLYDGGETLAKVKATEAEIAAQIYALSVTEQDTLQDAANYYGKILEYATLLKLAKANLKDLLKLQEQAEYFFGRQQVTITDVAQVKAEVASARITIAQYRGQMTSAHRRLRAMGTGATVAAGSLATDKWPVLPAAPQSLDEALTIGDEENPSVLEYEYLVKQQEYNIRAHEGALLPELDFYNTVKRKWDSSTYTGIDDYKEHTREDAWSIGATVTVPLYSGGENFAYIRQAKQNASQARYTLRDTRDTVRGEVGSYWATMIAAKEMLESARMEVKAWESAVEGFQRQFQAGTSTMQNILIAKENLYNAQTSRVTAQSSLFTATVDLLTTIGRFNAVHLNLPVKTFDAHGVVEKARYRFFGLSAD